MMVLESIRGSLGRFAVAIVLVMLPALAFAHARLERSVPAAQASLRTAPIEVVIWFSEGLEASFSTIVVRDSAGRQVDKNDSGLDRANKKQLRVSLQPLTAGTYQATWNVLSVDGHKSSGEFAFSVVP
jgi:methionine-rich copper-binding protein CopC